MKTLTDEELLVRHRGGDDEALRELIVRYHDDLLRFLVRLLGGNRAAADDVFQEAFLQVHLAAESFDASRRFRPWLFTIAANKARDLLRKNGRRQTLELSAPIGGQGGDGGTYIDLVQVAAASPDAGLDAEEQNAMVQRALNALSPSLREVLLLAYFQRMSYAQIADEIGIPLGTVKSRLHSAVAKFAAAWKRLASGNGGGASGSGT